MLNPKTGFMIARDDALSNTRRRSLDLLYQPLLHPTAYALVIVLWQLSEIHPDSRLQRPVHDLFAYLNVDAKTFLRARERLEGAGLLKTLYRHDSYQTFYVFYLIQPLSARAFFREDLLSTGLLEAIGDQRFTELNRALVPKPRQFKHVRNLTRDFLQVYNVGSDRITNISPTIQKARREMKPKAASSLKSDRKAIDRSNKFDFRLLLRILQNSYTDVKAVKQHRHLILTEDAVYGLDELAMAKYLEAATSISNNQINFAKFKALIAHSFQSRRQVPIKTGSASEHTDHNSQLSKDEAELVRAADFYPPVRFLRDLRRQTNHNPNVIVTRNEEQDIQQAMSYGAFRDNRGVINILLYYMVVSQKMPALKSKFMQYMISAWSQENVGTPSDALAEIHRHQKKRMQRWRHYQKRYHRYSGRPRVKQKLPDWAKKGYRPKLHRTDPKLQRKIRRQLKKLNRRNLT